MPRTILLALALLLSWSAAAETPTNVWISPMAGAALSEGEGSPAFALGLGRRLVPTWAVELAVRHAEGTSAPRHSSLDATALWSPWREVPLGRPYFALALGAGRFEDGSGDMREGLEVQGGAGLLRRLGPDWDLRLDLRYAHAGTHGDAALGAWTALLGLRYRFGQHAAIPEMTPQPVRVVEPGAARPALDGDGDSVLDADDRCPETTAGTRVGLAGCPLDPDEDGVPERFDRCPNSPSGARVGIDGCALQAADGDHDGVADGLDRCGDSLTGLAVDGAGCALGGQKMILEGLQFELDSARSLAPADAILDRVAQALRGQPTMRVEIGGHSCAIGPEYHNLELSKSRAEAVRAALLRRGIDPARIIAEGYGEYRPIADNDSEAERERNRRVELTVIDP